MDSTISHLRQNHERYSGSEVRPDSRYSSLDTLVRVKSIVGEPLDGAGGSSPEDDEPGFPERDRAWRSEYGHATAGDRTGSGPAIARAIVDTHDWTVQSPEESDDCDGVDTPHVSDTGTSHPPSTMVEAPPAGR